MSALHLLSPRGFRAAGVYAGIKSKPPADVGLLVCPCPVAAAAAFTTNKVFAAPVEIGWRHLARGRLRGVVVNSGNANACTGVRGERDAIRMCQLAALAAGGEAGEYLPSSTGIIGHPLPMKKIERGILEAGKYLGDSKEHALLFGDAIMTTDTKRKTAAVKVRLGRNVATIAGVAKGAGMIGPRMAVGHATLLGYITTDVRIGPGMLRKSLADAVDDSFNCVTIDDHTSTNDTVAILASGESDVVVRSYAERRVFAEALLEVCQSLAQQVAADGEGATKLVTVRVRGVASDAVARAIARAIADSPLVKCAMHGNDPNWGRIVSAAGMAGAPFNPRGAVLALQGVVVFRRGAPVAFDAAKLSKSLDAPRVSIDLDCGGGGAGTTFWTCDLSREYVAINADYHT